MKFLNKYIEFSDSLSIWVGKGFAWAIVILCFSTIYEVTMAYVLNMPTLWAFDFSLQMYGALFIMSGAYTLCNAAHVRGDVIYRLFPIKTQASIDIVLYFLFFFPGICALAFAGIEYAGNSWMQRETSWNSPAQIQIYMIKTLIPAAGFLLIIAGISEVFRAIIALRTGKWPARTVAAEETEKILMRKNSKGILIDVGQDKPQIKKIKKSIKKIKKKIKKGRK